MGVETNTKDSARRYFENQASERYMLIHKRPVGPKTAARLFFLYEELSEVQRPVEMYQAGWAAAEAGIVGTNQSSDWRHRAIEAGLDCWRYALILEQERAAEAAWRKGTYPSTFQSLRIESVLAMEPVLAQLPDGLPTKDTLDTSFNNLLSVARQNADNMQAELAGPQPGRVTNHIGLGFEFNSQLSFNRLKSRNLLALTTLARGDDGSIYPNETHDIQAIGFKHGNIDQITPIEVKSTLKGRHFDRYDAALIGGHRDLLIGDSLNLAQSVELFEREQAGTASHEDLLLLDQMTDSVIHSLRHYLRSQESNDREERHCRQRKKCAIPLARAGSLALQLSH